MVKEKRQETQILKMEFLENGALVAEGMAKDIGAIKFMEEQEPGIREQISSRIKVPGEDYRFRKGHSHGEIRIINSKHF